MKIEMNYKKERGFEVLEKGISKGYNWFIVSYGTHPCCYIGLPREHKYFGKVYDKMDINCHGGLTFASSDYHYSIIDTPNIWWIGWDYAHWGDYMGYKELLDTDNNSKKWTRVELKKEVMKVIKQLERGKKK